VAVQISVVVSVHDPAVRKRLRRLLESQVSVSVAAECAGGAHTVRAIRQHEPALVLLDAQMPDMNAFGIVEEIGADEMPSVVFITKLDRSVLRVLEVHGIAYLLQPFDDERFHSTFRRAVLQTEQRALAGVRRRLARMLAADEQGSKERRIPVRNAGKTQFVDLDDIRWVEGAGLFSRLHLDDRTHVVKVSLDALADQFADDFLRIHSTLVRSSEIAEIQRTGEGEARVTLRDGRHLRVSHDSPPEVVQTT
jgi:two-component system LytT family response regulator